MITVYLYLRDRDFDFGIVTQNFDNDFNSSTPALNLDDSLNRYETPGGYEAATTEFSWDGSIINSNKNTLFIMFCY